jgi:outer membrane murein-binding lipoprotein Lpp
MKFRKILAAMLAITLLAGCGGNTDTAEIEALLDQAKTTMATVESMSAEMTMEMDMGMNGEVIETTTLARIRSQQEPLKMAMEMSMVMSDGTTVDQMKMYAVEEDGHLHTYMSTADIWYAETLEMDELSQYNADENMDLYLDNIADFKSAGKEDINGIQTTKISGIITGDAVEEAIAGSGLTASAQSMGISEEMMTSMYEELGDLPVSLWIDAEGYVLKYELDMTQMMQKIMDESLKAMGAQDSGLQMKIEKTSIAMVCSDFNAVGEIIIPEAALNVPVGEHVHVE